MDDPAIQKIIDEIDRAPFEENLRSWIFQGHTESVEVYGNKAALVYLARCFLAAAIESTNAASPDGSGKEVWLSHPGLKQIKKQKLGMWVIHVARLTNDQLIEDPVPEPQFWKRLGSPLENIVAGVMVFALGIIWITGTFCLLFILFCCYQIVYGLIFR